MDNIAGVYQFYLRKVLKLKPLPLESSGEGVYDMQLYLSTKEPPSEMRKHLNFFSIKMLQV